MGNPNSYRVPGFLVSAAIAAALASTTASATAQPATGTITGRVVDRAGSPMSGVLLTVAADGTPLPAPATTDVNGTYIVTGLAPAVYTVTPTGPAVAFTPSARAVTLLGGSARLDFSGSPVTFAIVGLVLDANGSPLGGVTVAAGGLAAATTDAGGRYAIAGVAPGTTVTVSPALAGFSFTPVSQSFSAVQGDVAAPPFVAAGGIFRRYLAEGAINGFFDTSIALLNASGVATVARLVFQPSSGGAIEHQVPLDGLARVTINPKTLGLGDADFATVVESTQPIVVDRTMRWDASGYGSHAEASVASPQTVWYFAEGATTGTFNLFYLLQNPGAQQAQVEVRYLRPAPLAPIVKTYAVAPASRRTLFVNQEDPALDEAEISAVITSTNGVPIIAERAMYTHVGAQVFGAGHESAGIAAPASQWFLAEGATGPFFHLFVLVANPTATAAPLEFRYLLTDGRVIVRTHTVAPQSRLTVGVHDEDPALASAALSTIVTSTAGVPVLVERAMWWPANGPAWYEAHASAGATATGTRWAVADGETGGPDGAETYLLLANTATFAGIAEVTLVFEGGGTATRRFALLPSSRLNVAVGVEFPEAAGRRFGALVESMGALPAPIVVERAMYSNAGGSAWAAGTNLLATRLTGRPDAIVIQAPAAVPGALPAPVTTAGVLGGDPETPAAAVLPDVVAERVTPVGEIIQDEAGHRMARTMIEIAFARTATVAQVNSVLDALGGRIVNAIAGVPIVVVRVPDPGTLEALRAVIARAAAQAAVRYVNPVRFPEPASLPDTHSPASARSDGTIDHLLAARAPAAWNVQAALDDARARPPLAVVTDFFGAGPPNAAVDAAVVPGDFVNIVANEHGYHVLGIMAGTFAGVPSLTGPPNTVVGVFPRTSDVRVFDHEALPAGLPNLPAYANEVVRLVRDTAGGVVINSSLQFRPPLSVEDSAAGARAWIEKVRTGGGGGTSLEGRFVHAQAAGNSSGALAALASEPAAATLLQNLTDSSGAPLANLTNTVVVENRMNTPAEPFEPGCRASTSNIGGTIAAVGTDVFSLRDPGTLAGNKSGTSMASPGVAALAAYLWSLDPSLSAQEIVGRLRATARPGVSMADPRCSTIAVASAPAIDAYAAVLSADRGLTAPLVRAALLDIVDQAGADTPDGRFDERDLERFVSELDTRAGQFDYSRFDLNGDGRTGGTTTDRFDLDANTLPGWTSVPQIVETASLSFNEAQLTDQQILCYYAYSSLYAGTPGLRTALLSGRCALSGARLVAHHGRIETTMSTWPVTAGVLLERPNPTTDLLTPWVFDDARSQTGQYGTVSSLSRNEADDMTVTADGLTGGTFRWSATCAANANQALPSAGVSTFVHYRASVEFVVTVPRARISWQGEIVPTTGGGEVGQAQARIQGGAPVGLILDANTHTSLGPITLAGSQVRGPNTYTVSLANTVACAAQTSSPASTAGRASAWLSFSVVPVP